MALNERVYAIVKIGDVKKKNSAMLRPYMDITFILMATLNL